MQGRGLSAFGFGLRGFDLRGSQLGLPRHEEAMAGPLDDIGRPTGHIEAIGYLLKSRS